jgi:hypothetical protein
LPEGLELASDGTLSGRPLKAGTYRFVVRGQNSAGIYDKEITVEVMPENYCFTVGFGPVTEWGTDYQGRSDGALEDFAALLIDGKEVPRTSYSLERGSVVITLFGSYLDTLEDGEYAVTAVYRTEPPIR